MKTKGQFVCPCCLRVKGNANDCCHQPVESIPDFVCSLCEYRAGCEGPWCGELNANPENAHHNTP